MAQRSGGDGVIHDLAQKRLALLKEAMPTMSRVAALFHPGDQIGAAAAADRGGRTVAGARGQLLPGARGEEVEGAFREALANRTDAFCVVAGQSGVIAAPLVELALLPVEQPAKFNLVLSLRTAREIGVEFPPTRLSPGWVRRRGPS